VLTRDLADQGHYPAIDIEASISRAMTEIVPLADMVQVRRFKQLYSAYRRSRDLINVGAYVSGADPVVDEALRLREPFLQYLRQDIDERDGYASSRGRLNSLLATAAA
jgi:flagellum-specific ATP synthase